jgi:predicted nucleotidyltransferase
MLTKKYILETLVNEFPKLKQDFKVRRIGLFGSYSQNLANDDSDIDLVIEFSEPIGLKFIQLCDYLEHLFNKNVDILMPAGLESIKSKSIIDNILKTIQYVDAA